MSGNLSKRKGLSGEITNENLDYIATRVAENANVKPRIGDNGNWFVGLQDTGMPSRGEKGDKGDKGAIGANGADGRGITSIEKTVAEGKTDTYTIHFTDGTSTNYTVENGKDGVSCFHTWNGTVLSITSANGTTAVDLKGDKGEKGNKGDTGTKGDKGDKGDTPQRGIDYYTPEEKEAFVTEVIEAVSADFNTALDGILAIENAILGVAE